MERFQRHGVIICSGFIYSEGLHCRNYWLLFKTIIPKILKCHGHKVKGEDSLGFYTNWWLCECDRESH